ncbi:hypothetical protein [Ktedonobacter robiniae]|uniref:Uncharacterized protein n=1 Tax=Ktedonobacter robiniae TaxID=2778365 RepID=A0ABQ3URX1_9CHLR|nr:hypothetical protein [Ktedonobacter robiniae]GHO55521.1 hypothetical protein KSB_39960 [Ktedonobacter robiniae]
MTPEDFAAMIAKAVTDARTPVAASQPAPEPVQKAAPSVSLEDVQNLLISSFGEFSKAIDAKIEKATTFSREGVGRTGTVAPEDSRDADPVKHLLKKASDPAALDDTDKALISALTNRALTEGMLYE